MFFCSAPSSLFAKAASAGLALALGKSSAMGLAESRMGTSSLQDVPGFQHWGCLTCSTAELSSLHPYFVVL